MVLWPFWPLGVSLVRPVCCLLNLSNLGQTFSFVPVYEPGYLNDNIQNGPKDDLQLYHGRLKHILCVRISAAICLTCEIVVYT